MSGRQFFTSNLRLLVICTKKAGHLPIALSFMRKIQAHQRKEFTLLPFLVVFQAIEYKNASSQSDIEWQTLLISCRECVVGCDSAPVFRGRPVLLDLPRVGEVFSLLIDWGHSTRIRIWVLTLNKIYLAVVCVLCSFYSMISLHRWCPAQLNMSSQCSLSVKLSPLSNASSLSIMFQCGFFSPFRDY